MEHSETDPDEMDLEYHSRESCPWCGKTDKIYSVYRDGGSTLYHSGCEVSSKRWGSKEWYEKRKERFDPERMRRGLRQISNSESAYRPGELRDNRGYGLWSIT